MVAVLNKNLDPLMPCSERKARLLLAQGKAKVHKQYPFTIKLKYGSSGYKQGNNINNKSKTQSSKKELETKQGVKKRISRQAWSQRETPHQFQIRKNWGSNASSRFKCKRRKRG